MSSLYTDPEPPRSEIDASREAMVIEFGAPWCGHCQGAQAHIAAAFAAHPELRHLKLEDGRDRRLGRTFTVKLWPTLIFLKHGQEVARVVRPASADEIRLALAQLDQA